MATNSLIQTLQSLHSRLKLAGIDYCLLGGMALSTYGYIRATEDIDILLSSDGLALFQQQLLGRGYLPAFPSATRAFTDTQTNVRIEVLVAGEYPGDGKPKAIAFPDPASASSEQNGLVVIDLTRLVELKLASGMTARGRLKDLADVQELIRAMNLPSALAQSLDASVQAKYLELWEDVQD